MVSPRNLTLFEKVKPIVEWIISLILRLRLRKTYWSIAVPLALFLFIELTKKMQFILKLINELHESSEGIFKSVCKAASIYVSLSLPWWVYLFIVLLLASFTFIYVLELKAKRAGMPLSAEELSDTILNKLSKRIDEIESKFSFNPDPDWFSKQCQISISDLGTRYTPELNFKLEVSSIFEGLGRTKRFKNDFTYRIDQMLIKGRKALSHKPEIEEKIATLEASLEAILTVFQSIDLIGNSDIPIEDFNRVLDSLKQQIEGLRSFYYDEERKIQEEKNEYRFLYKYGYEIQNLRDFEYELTKFTSYLNSSVVKLANNPVLILDGKAGIGKSHLVGDIVSDRERNDYTSLLLLGQHFLTDEDPWIQIAKKLHIEGESGKILNALNELGKANGKRVLLFIDAINEGRGKYFWPSYIRGFIEEIKAFEYVGLILSIRSSYKDLIFPKQDLDQLKIVEHTHHGFKDVEYEASKLFFDNYKIELPSVPLLHPEFQNPLFLKLFCEGINKSGLKRIPEGLQGITSILNLFISSTNNILARPTRCDYSESLNLVKKSIDAIVFYTIENQMRYTPYETAYNIVEDIAGKYIQIKGFLEELITEGIFSKNLFWKSDSEYEECIYLTYERFEDHLAAQVLLERNPELEIEFKENGNLFRYVDSPNSINIHKGLIDAFSIQIPEIKGRELFEYLPNHKDEYEVIESFIESLLWRKVETISENSKDYVNNHVFKYQGTYDFFWETMLSVAIIPNHYFNAYTIHSYLMNFSLADRDSNWTQMLQFKYSDGSSVKRLIDWAWNENDRSYISNESIKLAGITLAWVHTSTNRRLRDCSTKAMISLLKDRISVLLEILKLFEQVNDPYVYERLFAVAYGVAVRSNEVEQLSKLSEYIYSIIFNSKLEIYPHVLLRDYARGVIEQAYNIGCTLSFKIDLVRPPYKSSFPSKLPTNDEIKAKYDIDYESKEFKDYHRGQRSILRSMVTDGSGRMYGDFGRYTFQSALSCWHLNENALSNLAITWIFENYGYDAKKHGDFDRSIGTGRARGTIPNERIGKKYQWIALYEMLARVSDNFQKYERWGLEKDKEEPYQGPWEPYVRDIDPTLLINSTVGLPDDEIDENWWSPRSNIDWQQPREQWVIESNDLPVFEELIEAKDDNDDEWLILQGYPEWAEPRNVGDERWDRPHKRIWTHIRSYLIKESDIEDFKLWANNQDFMGRWMPESNSKYELFSREYYWSPGYLDFLSKYSEGDNWRDVHDEETGNFITKVHIPIEEFTWEEEFDESKEHTISFLKPSHFIYEGMNLRYGKKEGEFIDDTDQVVCFASNVYHKSKSRLLVKKEPFQEYLKENDLSIIWTVLGEKQVIGGSNIDTRFYKRMRFSGVYGYEQEKLSGQYQVTID